MIFIRESFEILVLVGIKQDYLEEKKNWDIETTPCS
jgi:hypothetical protein